MGVWISICRRRGWSPWGSTLSSVKHSRGDTALQEYIFGGQLGLREKQRVAAILRRVAGREATDGNVGILPTYYSSLLELITRFVRNPQALVPVMRYAEWLGEAVAADSVAPAQKVFSSRYHQIGGKLLADICGFLVAAAELQATFRNAVRDLLEAPAENIADTALVRLRLPNIRWLIALAHPPRTGPTHEMMVARIAMNWERNARHPSTRMERRTNANVAHLQRNPARTHLSLSDLPPTSALRVLVGSPATFAGFDREG
jgi:hypothetical protein